ncbi:MAG: phosphopantothenate/pantothenate synthetase [candidate division WOR-3 bacterium]
MKTKIYDQHPRADSLRIRELLIEGNKAKVVATAGLIAFGRGEAFDYLLGERTIESAKRAIKTAAALILTAQQPVISVNGNVAALVPQAIAELTKITKTKVEVNIFYRSAQREKIIKEFLLKAGIKEVLGTEKDYQVKIDEIMSERRIVDARGILIADVVLVPLEDGDRTEALIKMGKKVIAIDLNPLSRTAQKATVTIVDNIIRAMPLLLQQIRQLANYKQAQIQKIINNYDNRRILRSAIAHINQRLSQLAKDGF